MSKNSIISTIIICCGIQVFVSCNTQITDDHFPVSSRNINISKNKGVYIGTYHLNPNYFFNHEGKKYQIKEIFIENQHSKRHNGKIEFIGGKQMVIVLQDTIDKGFNFEWELRSTNGMSFTSKSSNKLHSNMKYNHLDSILLEVHDISKKPEVRITSSVYLILKQ